MLNKVILASIISFFIGSYFGVFYVNKYKVVPLQQYWADNCLAFYPIIEQRLNEAKLSTKKATVTITLSWVRDSSGTWKRTQ